MLNNYDLIVFDLDGTLSQSKMSMDKETAGLFIKLLSIKKVAVMSGGGWRQFEVQFLGGLPGTAENFNNLVLLPTSGTRLYVWRGTWCEQYSENLSSKEKEKINAALSEAVKASNYDIPKVYGAQVEDRGSQITFSAVGQQAPIEVKSKWDPDQAKRKKLADILHKKIPEFDVRIGGTTSIDITRRGVNKGYGIRKLEQFFNIGPEKILFVGDALFHGGNDYPAKATGVDTVQVAGPDQTRELIRSWVKTSSGAELSPASSPSPDQNFTSKPPSIPNTAPKAVAYPTPSFQKPSPRQ